MINICIDQSHLGPDSFESIEAVVKRAVISQESLNIDMSRVNSVNGDFFTDFIRVYMESYREHHGGTRLDAIKAIHQKVTLTLIEGSPVYRTSYAGRPNVFGYDFIRPAA